MLESIMTSTESTLRLLLNSIQATLVQNGHAHGINAHDLNQLLAQDNPFDARPYFKEHEPLTKGKHSWDNWALW